MFINARQFRNRSAKLLLARSKCMECSRIDSQNSNTCYFCGSSNLAAIELTREGEVLTFTVQHVLPEEFETPMPIGIVETPEGGNVLGMFSEVNNPHGINIGETVEIVIKKFARKNGQVIYEPKFRRLNEVRADE